MKERSINDLFQTPKSYTKPRNFQNYYANFNQKGLNQNSVPDLIIYPQSGQQTIQKHERYQQINLSTKKRNRDWPLQKNKISQKQSLVQSIYLPESLKKAQRKNFDDLPPLTESISYEQKVGEVILVKEQSPKIDKDQEQNKYKFIKIAIEVLNLIQNNKQVQMGWINKARSLEETLRAILLNEDRLNLFLKKLQQTSIDEKERGQNNQKIVKNNKLLSCLLCKIKKAQKLNQGTMKIKKTKSNFDILFNEKIQDQQMDNKIKENNQKLKLKNKFIEEVKNQYDKIVNNYAVAVMNIINQKNKGMVPQIRELPKLVQKQIIQRNQRKVSQIQSQIQPVYSNRNSKSTHLWLKKDTFGQ